MSQSAANVYMKLNDVLPALETVLTDPLGNPLYLAGATVNFVMRKSGTTGAPKVNAAVQIINPDTGRVRYTWAVGDTDVAGYFDLEWRVTMPSGGQITIPNVGFQRLLITAALA